MTQWEKNNSINANRYSKILPVKKCKVKPHLALHTMGRATIWDWQLRGYTPSGALMQHWRKQASATSWKNLSNIGWATLWHRNPTPRHACHRKLYIYSQKGMHKNVHNSLKLEKTSVAIICRMGKPVLAQLYSQEMSYCNIKQHKTISLLLPWAKEATQEMT